MLKNLLWSLLGAGLALLVVGVLMLGPLNSVLRGLTPSPGAPQTAVTRDGKTVTPMPTGTPVRTTLESALSWTRRGGLAGICQRLQIDGTGAVHYGSCVEALRDARLSAAEMDAFRSYIERFASFDGLLQDNPGGPDNLTVSLSLQGGRGSVPSQSDQAELASWVAALYGRLAGDQVRADSVARARALLAEWLAIAPSAVDTLSVEAVMWPDACLGVPAAGEACALVVTPGYSIRLQALGSVYDYRADNRGQVRAGPASGLSSTPTSATVPSRTVTRSATGAPTHTVTARPSATITAQPTTTRGPAPTGYWRGEYYANDSLAGYPSAVRQDADISFDWGYSSPIYGVPVDHFSVRWSRRVHLSEGLYHFTLRTDDGARLWVGGTLIVDAWRGGYSENVVSRRLGEGDYDLIVEYFELEGVAKARMTWEKQVSPTRTPTATRTPTRAPTATPTPLAGAWTGYYFANPTLSGAAALVRSDATLDFDWGKGVPASGLPKDDFSVRWLRRPAFDEGPYRFDVWADDGVRLWVDNVLVIDAWIESPLTQRSGHLWMAAGYHDIRVEYFERASDAAIRVVWNKLTTFAGWRGEYFANRTLSGRPQMVRDDSAIAFDWGKGSPALVMPSDGFSVRWTRTFSLSAGRYRAWSLADDGARIFVDGARVVDAWEVVGSRVQGDLDLAAGSHEVVVEYHEQAGNAYVSAGLDLVSTPTATVATATVTPSRTPTATATGTHGATATTTQTSTPMPSSTTTPLATHTATPTQTFTATPGPSHTPPPTATHTTTPTATASATPTATASATPTATDTATPTATATATPAEGGTPVPTHTATPTGTTTPVAEPWAGTYYANTTLTGAPVYTETLKALVHDWAREPLPAGVPISGYSARWSTTHTTRTRAYAFRIRANGGIRVRVDGQLVLDMWDLGQHESLVRRLTGPGSLAVTVEYRQVGARGSIALQWLDAAVRPQIGEDWTMPLEPKPVMPLSRQDRLRE